MCGGGGGAAEGKGQQDLSWAKRLSRDTSLFYLLPAAVAVYYRIPDCFRRAAFFGLVRHSGWFSYWCGRRLVCCEAVKLVTFIAQPQL
jgi:hypothetical protein